MNIRGSVPKIIIALLACIFAACSEKRPSDEEIRNAITAYFAETNAAAVVVTVGRVGERGKGDFAAPGSQDAYWPVEFSAKRTVVNIGPIQASEDLGRGSTKMWKDKMGTWRVAQLEMIQAPSTATIQSNSQSSFAVQATPPPIASLERVLDERWSQLINVYQRRADLVPNVINTVASAANFQTSVTARLTSARTGVSRARVDPDHAPADKAQLDQFQAAQSQLSNALSQLLVVSENYPKLRQNSNFQQLQAQLEGTENRISVQRGEFNEAVRNYNALVSDPSQRRPFFTQSNRREEAPSVNFDFGNSTPGSTP